MLTYESSVVISCLRKHPFTNALKFALLFVRQLSGQVSHMYDSAHFPQETQLDAVERPSSFDLGDLLSALMALIISRPPLVPRIVPRIVYRAMKLDFPMVLAVSRGATA
jgi:hypothetical protein